LVIPKERSAIRQRPLEGGAGDVISYDDVVGAERTGGVERDASDITPMAAGHGDLVSVFGSGLESPQAGGRGV
jgi:hypothetical protein